MGWVAAGGGGGGRADFVGAAGFDGATAGGGVTGLGAGAGAAGLGAGVLKLREGELKLRLGELNPRDFAKAGATSDKQTKATRVFFMTYPYK